MADYDLAIIGGGLTGAGIARDAAGRGLRVVLFEQSDLGSGASSASAALIAGDLEQFERRALLRVRAADRRFCSSVVSAFLSSESPWHPVMRRAAASIARSRVRTDSV